MKKEERSYLVTRLIVAGEAYPGPSIVTLVNPVFDIRQLPVRADDWRLSPFEREMPATIHLSRLEIIPIPGGIRLIPNL